MELTTLQKANDIQTKQADIKTVIAIIAGNKENKQPFKLAVGEGFPTLLINPDGTIDFMYGESEVKVELPSKTKSLIDDFASNLKFALEMKLSDLETEFANL